MINRNSLDLTVLCMQSAYDQSSPPSEPNSSVWARMESLPQLACLRRLVNWWTRAEKCFLTLKSLATLLDTATGFARSDWCRIRQSDPGRGLSVIARGTQSI